MEITTFIVIAVLFYTSEASQYTSIKFKDPQTIHSPGYPGKYPKESHFTWEWTRDRGFWGIEFKHVDLNCDTDRITISDGSGDDFPPICKLHAKLYTTGSTLRVEFVANTSQPRSGFSITVLYGDTTDDLDRQFLSLVTQPTTQGHQNKNSHIIPILLAVLVAVAVVTTLFFLGVWIVSRRRLTPHQAISLNVNVHGVNIRRGSGVRHARKTSSQSDSDDVTATANTSQPIRTLTCQSPRSWSVRAHTEVSEGFISRSHVNEGFVEAAVFSGGDEDVHAVPNMYVPIETLLISSPEGGPKTHALVGRAYNLNLTAPKMTSSIGPSDDGYLKMESQLK